MDNKDRLIKWIWLSLACGPGSLVPEMLYSAFGDIDAIYEASEEEYAEISEDIKCLTQLCSKSTERATYILKWCEIKKVTILTPDDPAYPVRLYETHGFPCVLYAFGNVPKIDKSLVFACVGTREMTEYGETNAYSITRDLAKEGAIIVSGLALGIDSICHRAALDVGGFTIAVLGCGIDTVYPPQNRALMTEIARKGLILTEFPIETQPSKFNFPIRNRIISGISNATIVFEAAEKSGSLITVNYSVKQGRPVYALPGNAGNLSSLGTNGLLTKGVAKPFVNAGDIMINFKDQKKKAAAEKKQDHEATIVLKRSAGSQTVSKQRNDAVKDAGAAEDNPVRKTGNNPPITKLSTLEEQVYNTLSLTAPLSCEQIRIRAGLPISKVMAAISILEIKNLILRMPGGNYVRIK